MNNGKTKLMHGIVVYDRLHDIPTRIRNFGDHPESPTMVRVIGMPSMPVNLKGEIMYRAWEDDMEFCVLVEPETDSHYRELAEKTINLISKTGSIARYDMVDGTLFYVSYAE